MERITKYRIFYWSVGRHGYSAVEDVMAFSASDVVVWANHKWPTRRGKHIAISHQRKHLWPDGKTGLLPGLRGR